MKIRVTVLEPDGRERTFSFPRRSFDYAKAEAEAVRRIAARRGHSASAETISEMEFA